MLRTLIANGDMATIASWILLLRSSSRIFVKEAPADESIPVTAESLMTAPGLRAIAGKTYREMPYPISPELFWVHGGVWRHFGLESAGDSVLDPLSSGATIPPEKDSASDAAAGTGSGPTMEAGRRR